MQRSARFCSSVASAAGARFTRRRFLRTAAATSLVVALPRAAAAATRRLEKPVQIGLIADLHHDVMHDGLARMNAFVEEMAIRRPHAVVQLGDFAYPNSGNKKVIDLFNHAHDHALHVIGNHDRDAGHTRQQCLDLWGMDGRYYATNIGGLWLLVLDGNDDGSPTHQGGYASYVGDEQRKWLRAQLRDLVGPVIVVSHQPLAGAFAVDNAGEMQAILGAASDKVLLALNGHSHIDDLLQIDGVNYLHVNSASYQWVGGKHQHESYSADVHAEFPWISHTCPYRDALFATLTVDPQSMTVHIGGRQSAWVGPSPSELGVAVHPPLKDGEEIAPRIQTRQIVRVAN